MPEHRFKPSIHLDEKDLPAIREWEVGQKYVLILEVKQTSKNENEHTEGRKTIKSMSASFEIQKVSTPKKPFNEQTMKDFRNGTLKTKNGRTVRNFNDALKMAHS